MNSRMLAVMFVGCLAVASCGGGESTETTVPEDTATAPFHAIPADSVGVTGTATCSFSDSGESPDGGQGFMSICALDMSDPRVSGTERSDRYTFQEAGEIVSVWVADRVVLTNEDGAWRGTTQAADDATVCGETHYVGEGAYEGLEFHYYFCHVADPAQLRGWISGG